MKEPEVRFAGYRKPHPLKTEVEIKVQTDGSIDPASIVERVCIKSVHHVDTIKQSFKVTNIRFALSHA